MVVETTARNDRRIFNRASTNRAVVPSDALRKRIPGPAHAPRGRLRIAAVVLCSAIALVPDVQATMDRLPRITATTLLGRWEGFDPEGSHVYLLQITPTASFFLTARSTGGGPFVGAEEVAGRRVRKGTLVMELLDAKGIRSDLRGTGYATEDQGVLYLDVFERSGSSSRRVNSLVLTKTGAFADLRVLMRAIEARATLIEAGHSLRKGTWYH